MPAVKNKRGRYHHGDLRRALLDATRRLADERGVGGVTLREAARTAGVSQTAPYRHFADKQAMLAAASEEGFRLLAAELREALQASGQDPRAQLIELSLAYVRFALRRPAHFHLMFGHGSPPKAATPALQRTAREGFQLYLGAVARFVAAQGVRGSAAVKRLFFQAWALVHGIATLALERQILFDVGVPLLTRSAREAISTLLDGVGPRR